MLDTDEIKEFLDKQSCIISNLRDLVRTLTYKERVKDEKLCDSVREILDAIWGSSYEAGPEGETWPSWKKKPVKFSIAYLCKVLNIDMDLFNIERR